MVHLSILSSKLLLPYLCDRNGPDEAVVKRDEPVLEVERPRVEPHQFGDQPERREEVERAAIADDGGVLEDGDAVAVAHVTRQTLNSSQDETTGYCIAHSACRLRELVYRGRRGSRRRDSRNHFLANQH